MHVQLSVFDIETPAVDASFATLERRELGAGAWVEYQPQWLAGAGAVFDVLQRDLRWHADRRQMYDREVDVPRLTAWLPDDGAADSRSHPFGHPVLADMDRALCERYYPDKPASMRADGSLQSIGVALYRNGRDSVAMHGDRLGRLVNNAVVAIVSVGEPRRFLLKARAGGPSIAYSPGWGDLLVMGGSCQRDWLHGVPKVAHAGPRISIQFRPRVKMAIHSRFAARSRVIR